MARILRGEIRWASLDPVIGREQRGIRPVLVLSHDVFNARSETVIAMVLTSKEPQVGFPLAFELSNHGLRRRSWVKTGQIRTLSLDRLGRKLGRASNEDVQHAINGLNEIIE